MTKRQRTPKELQDLLAEQLQFLEASAHAFDSGFNGEAKRLAVAARVLLHDTKKSHSLLGQLRMKDVPFWDTALPNQLDNEAPHGGLVFIALGGKEPRYVAMLDDVPQIRQIPFEQWWSADVFTDDQKTTLSRKDLVLTAANQDGGAHVDPALNDTYARLATENSLGWVASDSTGTRPMPGPERAAIRQIAHELLKTLKPEYEKKMEPEAGLLLGGFVIKSGLNSTPISAETVALSIGPKSMATSARQPEQFVRNGPKIGRNEECPCGSGRKYKKCHGALG